MGSIHSIRSTWSERKSSSNHFGAWSRLLGMNVLGNARVCACGCLSIDCFVFSSGLVSTAAVQGRPLRWMGRSHSGLVCNLRWQTIHPPAGSPLRPKPLVAAKDHHASPLGFFWGSRVSSLGRSKASSSSLLRFTVCSSFSRLSLFS